MIADTKSDIVNASGAPATGPQSAIAKEAALTALLLGQQAFDYWTDA